MSFSFFKKKMVQNKNKHLEFIQKKKKKGFLYILID